MGPLDNDGTGTMSRTILVEKRARKVAEDDALRLYNRVRQLQKEEEKAHKRIADTRRKAKEIIKQRERNESKLLDKEQRLREIDTELGKQRQSNVLLKEEAVKNRTEMENRLYAEKVSLVLQAKDERVEIDRLLAESKLLARKEALEQKEAIRAAQEDGRRRIEQIKATKLHSAQGDYEKRLKEEMDAKCVKEREIERLAQMELELIERLKAKQMEQRRAYQQLEAVLSLGSARLGEPVETPTVRTLRRAAVACTGPARQGPVDRVWVCAPPRADCQVLPCAGAEQPPRSEPPAPQPPPREPHGPTLALPHRNAPPRHSSKAPLIGAHSSAVEAPSEAGSGGGEPSEEDVARAFSMYDTDGAGEVPTLSLDGLMKDLHVPLTAMQLSQAISQLDTELNGKISFGGFLVWWKG
ncbi:MAG: hypothetical protein WDW36_001566 [Sanguina aurantia]